MGGGGGSSSPSYYSKDIASCNHVLYSFICLDQHPNPDFPATKYWNGKALYESMTAADVIVVMTETDPHWENPYEWEHLSEDASIKDEQRMLLAKTMLALRTALDSKGMAEKTVGYTTRFNAFWDDEHGNKPANYTLFASDGEGLKIEETLNELGTSLNDVVDWVHIMQYDVPPSDLNCPDRMTLDTYVGVFDAFEKYVD